MVVVRAATRRAVLVRQVVVGSCCRRRPYPHPHPHRKRTRICCHNTSRASFTSSHRQQKQQQQQQQHVETPTVTSGGCTTSTTTTTNTSTGTGPFKADIQDDITTNRGTVEGVWMFCRHGDRVPGRCLSPPGHLQSKESAFWVSKLPYPNSEYAFEAFSKRFPLDVKSNTNQGSFLDVKRNPYGFLTQSGLIQLKENGRRYFQRYNQRGYNNNNKHQQHYPTTDDDDDRQNQHQPHFGNNNNTKRAENFLSTWDLKVYSTNYLRTVLSVQSFLDGLLNTNCYHPIRDRIYDPTIIKEQFVPSHTSWRLDENAEQDNINTNEQDDTLVKVKIRELIGDPLNAFDRNPDLIAELSSEVMLSEDFLQRDAGAAPLAARLANVLPGLVRQFRTDFSQRSPSGINWVEASDHFVCRASHDVGYARFTEFEHDDRVEQTLAAMSHQTLAHLTWRFRKWYQHKRLLAAIAAPPLREVADQILSTPMLGVNDKRPFVIYSCHDITILGLLYGIGADFLAGDDTSSNWRWWPKYGSQLCFELVRIKDNDNGSPPGAVTRDTHVVRVLLNGKPVSAVDHEWKGKNAVYMGSGPKRMLLIPDFIKVVEALEKAGGHDYDRLLGRR